MSMGGGGGGGQSMVQTGPSVAAASQAAQQQVLAAQAASQAATRNTNAAISALQGEYSTALTYANPIINTGNQAAAQLTYMLGLQAVSPGAAPTAPTKPTLQTALDNETQSQINQYIAQNTFINPYTTGAGNFQSATYLGGDGTNTPLIGGGSDIEGPNTDMLGINLVSTMVGGTLSQYKPPSVADALSNRDIRAYAAQASAADDLKQNLLPQYQQQLTNYNQNQSQWQKEEDLYTRYNAMGVASPADLTDIVQNLPGYQFQMNQGTSAIQNAASASGMLNSGSILQQLNQFGQGQASSYYNNYLNHLQTLAGYGAGATQQATSGAANLGNQIAGQYQNLGDAQANAYLAAGQAQASSYLTPLANQETRVTQLGGGGGGGAGIGSTIGSVAGLLGNFL